MPADRKILSVSFLFFFSLLTSAAAFGQSGSTAVAGNEHFTVAPAVAAPGQFIQFNWRVNSGTAFTMTPSPLTDEQSPLALAASRYLQVAPDITTVFSGVSVGAGGVQTGSPLNAVLSIVPVSLKLSQTNIAPGQSLTLHFIGPNNGSSFVLVTLPENSKTTLVPDYCGGTTCTGSYVTPPLGGNRMYMIEATGPYGGEAYSQRAQVAVNGGMSIGCTATPQAPEPGQPVTIAWDASHAASVRIDQGIGEVSPATSGKITVRPTQTTTYTCTATHASGDQIFARAKVIVSTSGVNNLNHIVYMLQENRSFDNYLGNLAYYRVNIDHIPGAQLSDVNDLHNLPPGFMLMNGAGQSFPPYHQRTECIDGLNINWNVSHSDMDLVGNNWLDLTQNSQYLMDKFLVNATPSQYDPTNSRPLGYYDWTDLPFYYELATQFNTSDTWYSPVPDTTVINRAYLFAGTSYGDIFPPGQNDWLWQRPTLFRILQNAGISWRYYYQDNSVFLAQWADWNNPQIQNNVRNIQEWYDILASQNADQDLPQVIFIEHAAATGYDEHPGNNVQTGSARVQQILNALLTSNAWPDSAFFLTYDEAGGLFDQEPPILVAQPDDKAPGPNQFSAYTKGLFNVTGFRVPIIVVSPWSKPQTVFHIQTDYTSILKLIETRFNLPPLTHRDAMTADLTDPMNGPFDFDSPQLLQVPPLPNQPTNGTCDYTLESYPGQ